LAVYEGRVEAVVPFRVEEVEGPVRLGVRVCYQACTETLCYPPADERLDLPLEAADLIRD
jgi:hypothetical protein